MRSLRAGPRWHGIIGNGRELFGSGTSMTTGAMRIVEMGYLNLRPEQSNIFFKLMEERYCRRVSTIVTTNPGYNAWYEFLGNKEMVAVLLDRVRHRCTTIEISGPSLRTTGDDA